MSEIKKSEFQDKVRRLLSSEDISTKHSRHSEDSMGDIKEYLKSLNEKFDFVIKQNKLHNERINLLIEENNKVNKGLEFFSKRIESLEKKIDNDIATSAKNAEDEFLKEIIKNVAKTSFNISIYPTKEELRYIMEEYLKLHNKSFYDKFEDESRWNAFYNLRLSSDLQSKIRSLRGGLASKARDIVFSYFGDSCLPPINNNASATEIAKWKKKKEVDECYKKVFDLENNKKSPVLLQLFEKVFAGEESPPTIHMAFVMALYTVLLDPNSQNIQVNESTMKAKIDNYMKILTDMEIETEVLLTGCNTSCELD